MDEGYDQICYTVGCENFASIALKMLQGLKIHCIVRICNGCLPKYQGANNNKQPFADAAIRKLFPDGRLVVPSRWKLIEVYRNMAGASKLKRLEWDEQVIPDIQENRKRRGISTLTLRGLFYILVSKNVLKHPESLQRSVKKVS